MMTRESPRLTCGSKPNSSNARDNAVDLLLGRAGLSDDDHGSIDDVTRMRDERQACEQSGLTSHSSA